MPSIGPLVPFDPHETSSDFRAREQFQRRRIAAINRFYDRQRACPKWVAFRDLADLFSSSARTPEAAKAMQDFAFEKLCQSIRMGEFDQNGRTMVLYLHERAVPLDEKSEQRG